MQQRSIFGRHYAMAVVAVIFVVLLAAAGLRSTPGVLMVPWEQAFGWSRWAISFAAACGVFLFGLTGPFSAAAMQRFGIRATVIVTWGLVSGIGSGCITNVLSATIVNRWFVTNRGLGMGLFAAPPPPALWFSFLPCRPLRRRAAGSRWCCAWRWPWWC